MDSKAAVSVAELLASEPGSVSGPTEIEGWLVGDTGTKNAWLAASQATFDVVAVQLDESTQIYELMLDCGIPLLGGSDYAFVNRAILTGSLDTSDDNYVLSDVDPVTVLQEVTFWLKPAKPLVKKKSDSFPAGPKT